MLEASGERLHAKACGDLWRLAGLPANDLSQVHWWQQILLWRGQNRIWTDLGMDVEIIRAGGG
jgi:hypothetical protein